MQCDTLADENGCDGDFEQCRDFPGASAYLVISSFKRLEAIFKNIHDAVKDFSKGMTYQGITLAKDVISLKRDAFGNQNSLSL